MLLELVDTFRCIRPHEDSWLVAAAYRIDGRHLMEGVLGCPVCRTEYPVRDGVVDFTGGAATAPAAASGAEVDRSSIADEAMRLAALLGLEEVRAPVLLAGGWVDLLATLGEIAPAPYILVNAAPPADGPPASALRTAGTIPLASGAAHGVALDAAAAADDGLVQGAVRALRPGGRLVAPSGTPVPAGVRELARDARHWVAERVAEATTTAPQPLLRRR